MCVAHLQREYLEIRLYADISFGFCWGWENPEEQQEVFMWHGPLVATELLFFKKKKKKKTKKPDKTHQPSLSFIFTLTSTEWRKENDFPCQVTYFINYSHFE